MLTAHTLAYTAAVPNSHFVIFGISADYDPQHHDQLQSLARSFGAGFTGLCFTVHREVIALHDDYVGELLTEANNQGLLP